MSRAHGVIEGGDFALMYCFERYFRVGTHPSYSEEHYGLLSLQRVASRLDQEIHALHDEYAWRRAHAS